MLVVADRGEEGMGWAAIDDFEFLYDVFEVSIPTAISIKKLSIKKFEFLCDVFEVSILRVFQITSNGPNIQNFN